MLPFHSPLYSEVFLKQIFSENTHKLLRSLNSFITIVKMSHGIGNVPRKTDNEFPHTAFHLGPLY